MKRSLALALALMLASSARAAEPRPTTLAMLHDRAAGQPLLLGFGKAGLIAQTSDGSSRHVLVAGAIDDAAYDPTLEIVFFRRGKELAALDLRLPKPKPVVLARGIGELISTGFVIVLADERRVESDGRMGPLMAALVLSASGQKTLEYDGYFASESYLSSIESDGDDSRALPRSDLARVKVVGAAWLQKLAARAPGAVAVADTSRREQGYTLPDAMFGCQFQKSSLGGNTIVWGRKAELRPGMIANGPQCTRSVRFGDERHLLAVTSMVCGDSCHLGCVLYDTQTSQFALPTAPAEWMPEVVQRRTRTCGPYHLLGDGKTYATHRSLCELGGACRELDITPIGWLGVNGTAYIRPPVPF